MRTKENDCPQRILPFLQENTVLLPEKKNKKKKKGEKEGEGCSSMLCSIKLGLDSDGWFALEP